MSAHKPFVVLFFMSLIPLATARALNNPTGLTVVARSTFSLTWQWDDTSSDETGYRVLRSFNNANISGDLPAGTTLWVQNGLTSNVSQQVYVQAFDGVGGTANSSSATFHALASP